jgi:hypothetical protein
MTCIVLSGLFEGAVFFAPFLLGELFDHIHDSRKGNTR